MKLQEKSDLWTLCLIALLLPFERTGYWLRTPPTTHRLHHMYTPFPQSRASRNLITTIGGAVLLVWWGCLDLVIDLSLWCLLGMIGPCGWNNVCPWRWSDPAWDRQVISVIGRMAECSCLRIFTSFYLSNFTLWVNVVKHFNAPFYLCLKYYRWSVMLLAYL